jgi:hypothetical protein
LDLDGKANGLDRAGEFHENTVAHGLHDAAVVFAQFRLDQLAAKGLQPGKRALFVIAHEPAVPGDISRQDGCQPSLDAPVSHDASGSDDSALAK